MIANLEHNKVNKEVHLIMEKAIDRIMELTNTKNSWEAITQVFEELAKNEHKTQIFDELHAIARNSFNSKEGNVCAELLSCNFALLLLQTSSLSQKEIAHKTDTIISLIFEKTIQYVFSKIKVYE